MDGWLDDDEPKGVGFFMPRVVDARLSAPRGEEYTNTRIAFGGDSLFEGEEEGEEMAVRASLDTPLPETNVGFRLLQKMGWTQGKGLGRNEDGKSSGLAAGHGCRMDAWMHG